jgi:hypothetical protein
MQPNPLWQEVPQHRFTLVRDGKRGMSMRRMAEKKMQRIVQSDVPRMLRSALAMLIRGPCGTM